MKPQFGGNYGLGADTGSFALTGNAASLLAARKLFAIQQTVATTPDHASLDITGDIELWAQLTTNWSSLPTNGPYLVHKDGLPANRSYSLLLMPTGALRMGWSTDGTSSGVLVRDSTATVQSALSLSGEAQALVKATLDVDNGASGHTVTFYTSSNGGSSWDQLGDPVVTAGTTSIYSGTAALGVGPIVDNAAVTIQLGRVYNAIGGTLVASFDSSLIVFGQSTFEDSTGKTWTVAASAIGDYRVTGVAATLFRGRGIVADTGAFVLTGQDAALKAARLLSAGTGAFVLTGQDAALKAARLLSAGTGSFILTGIGADLVYNPAGNYTLVANVGAFTLTGQDAALKADRLLSAGTGVFVLDGQAATLFRGRGIVADAGVFVLTGQDAALKAARLLSAGTGSFILTGNAAGLNWSGAEEVIVVFPQSFFVRQAHRDVAFVLKPVSGGGFILAPDDTISTIVAKG
ncbi:MAG: hypothetical protein IT514_15375 [Burkholderiales bacterium]|nr:hypothetical protein [Burkholderiales bacterium]